MKKVLLAILTILAIGSTTTAYATDNNQFSIYVNGNAVKFTDAKPFIDNQSRTMIPLKAVSTGMNADVSWDEKSQTAKVALGSKKIELPIGKNYGLIDGAKVEFDTITITSKGRTYVPLKFVSENLGFKIDYRFGQDRSIGLGQYHIINISNSATTGGAVSTYQNTNFDNEAQYSKFFNEKLGFFYVEDSTDLTMNYRINGITMEYWNSLQRPYTPNLATLSLTYEGEGKIDIDFGGELKPTDKTGLLFLDNALTYAFGTDGTAIATRIKSDLKTNILPPLSEWDEESYNTFKLVGKSFIQEKYTVKYSNSDGWFSIKITFK